MPRTAAQRQAFERYMDGGGGWLGFHGAGFGSNAWPWFTTFMGGARFSASNWPALPARVNADDPAHPILKGLPATFVAPINEWYAWTPSPRANPAVKVLLTLNASNFPLGVKNTLERRGHPGRLDQHEVPDGVRQLRPRRSNLLHAAAADDDAEQQPAVAAVAREQRAIGWSNEADD